jgi:outer membrane cobalamin receptor
MTLVAQTRVIEMPAKEVNLQEVISYLEVEYGFLFSYKNEVIESVKVIPPNQALDIDNFLFTTLENTKLQFEVVDDFYVLLSEKIDPLSEILEKRKITLCGAVRDARDKSALLGANVYIKNTQTGAFTDEEGNFSLKANIADNSILVISYTGYKAKEIPANDFLKKPCRKISLDLAMTFKNPIIVKEYLTDGIELKEDANSIYFQTAKIGTLPGQAEPDILNTIQFLPGITSPDGSASNVCIRGGTSDQNLILWEDIPVYHSAHYFGMISAFNPYIIDEAEVFRGGFSADYGGRISGVIDLKSKNVTANKPTIGVGVNMVNPYVYGKIPLLKNKASIVFSLRRSMAEIWRSPTYESITRRINQGVLLNIPIRDKIPEHIGIQNNFWFLDSNIKGSYQITDKDKISLAYFSGANKFDSQITDNLVSQVQTDTLNLENQGISLSVKHNWNERFKSSITGLQTSYGYDYNYGLVHLADNRPNSFGLKKSNINEQQIKFVNSYTTEKNHQLKLGLELVKYNVNYEITRSTRENPTISKDSLSDLRILHAAFNSAKDKKVGIDAGLRLNHYQSTEKFYFEPRLRFWYKPTDALNLHGHFGKYYQFLSQIVEIEGNNNVGIETAVWTLAGKGSDVPILDATQLQIGAIYNKNSWLIDAQVYYKKTLGLTSLATGFNSDLGPKQFGSSNTRGLDLLIKKRWKGLRTWVSYTLSKSDYLFPDFFDKEFAAPNDQRHILNFAVSQSFGKFKCSLGWRFASGRPYSIKENFRPVPSPSGIRGDFNLIPEVPEFNSEQLPNEHRLDMTISYTLLPKNGATWRGNIGLSLFNIYNQDNVYSRTFFIAPGQITGSNEMQPALKYIDRTDMGFTPNFVVRFEF